MKKIVFILLLAVMSIQVFSQKGNLTVGAKGGYVISTSDIKYNGLLYGVDIAYHISYPLEIAFTGLLNPDISRSDDGNKNSKEHLAVYSANLDLRLYLINQREWATGPALGGQYYYVNNKTAGLGADKTLGFNIGWHLRINLTDNVKINGGWRYTNAKVKDKSKYWSSDATFDMSHHLIYLGIGYSFALK
jgi:opacity protein-like surface antigen